jgi:hypothetical protein
VQVFESRENRAIFRRLERAAVFDNRLSHRTSVNLRARLFKGQDFRCYTLTFIEQVSVSKIRLTDRSVASGALLPWET